MLQFIQKPIGRLYFVGGQLVVVLVAIFMVLNGFFASIFLRVDNGQFVPLVLLSGVLFVVQCTLIYKRLSDITTHRKALIVLFFCLVLNSIPLILEKLIPYNNMFVLGKIFSSVNMLLMLVLIFVPGKKSVLLESKSNHSSQDSISI